MWDDPIVAEVRRIREALAERCHFDVHAVFADLRERQRQHASRLVRRQRDPHATPEPGSQRDAAHHPGR